MATYKSDGLRISTYANGVNGSAGKGISQIENYYFASTSDNINDIPVVGNNQWKKSIKDLTNTFGETYKYLWNYEFITYTDNSTGDTGRIMMAVYSKDGEEGRGVNDILEFYILTKTADSPVTLPNTNDDNGWTRDNGENSLPVPTRDLPYLWNYEIVDYTIGDDTTSGPVCIGTYGNSIIEVKEYYLATATNNKPDYSDDGWVSTIANTGQSETKPYLWNYEETTYSISNSIITPITLLSASPRSIKVVTEYYQQLSSSASAPEGARWTANNSNHNDEPDIPAGWSTARAALEPGKIMWNMEIIEYAAVDNEGKNLYEATPPAQAGYAGTNGANGRGINSTTISYAVTDELVDPSSISDWKPQTNIPSASSEQYLWTRTVIDYTEGEDSISYTYSYQGKTGEAGSSVTVKEIKYQQGDSATTAPTGTWTTDIPVVNQGKYLWTRTTYSDDTKSYGVSYQSIDGSPAQDFNITADSYMLKKSSPTATTYTNQITLTAHKMNVIGDVKWYKGNTTGSVLNTANTYTVTSPGTYYAVCDKWSDSVTIGEVTDGKTGPDGKPAIAIALSNPSMTFHAQTANEVEYCEVIVYEGGERLSYAASGTGTFSLTKKTDIQGKASIDNGKIKISDPSNDGSAVFTVTVRPKSGAAATSQDYTIYWKVVSDGDKGDQSEAIRIFAYNDTNTITPPEDPTTTINSNDVTSANTWTTKELDAEVGKKFVFTSTGVKTTKFTGSTSTVTYSGWTTPELWSAYQEGVDSKEYATFLRLMGKDSSDQTLYYSNGKMYINANFIKSNHILVTDASGNTVFSVTSGTEGSGGQIYLSGWTILPKCIESSYKRVLNDGDFEQETFTTLINSNIYNEGNDSYQPVFAIKRKYERIDIQPTTSYPFAVYGDGQLVANNATIRGYIEATSGKIGNYINIGDKETTSNIKYSYISTNSSPVLSSNPTLNTIAQYGGVTIASVFRDENYASSYIAVGDSVRNAVTVSSSELRFFNNGRTSLIKRDGSNNGLALYSYNIYIPGLILYDMTDGNTQIPVVGLFGVQERVPTSWGIDANATGTNRAFAIGPISNAIGSWGAATFSVTAAGYVYAANGYNDPSDIRLKNSFKSFSKQYDVFFDLIDPCLFKFNSGTSGRFHSGFKAQDIASNLEQSGLTTQDFAAICLDNESGFWSMRYSEFVALNTWQIQLLKPRMTAAEEKIAQLELEISSLKSEIENLKKS